jgi:2-hydroxymuconate-semialdehyde hydrolase
MKTLLSVVLVGVVLILLMSLSGGALNRRLETVERAKAPSDGETNFVDTRSGRVHVLDLGESDEVVLLLHGTGRSVADWQEGFAEQLARTHRVIGIDYYGHGLSDRAHRFRYGIALWARQAIDVLDALGIDRVTVVGHSAGGCVAAILTADHPERVERAVFIGHGIAMDPAQIVPLMPGFGELRMARTAIFSDIFSADHERRLESAYSIQGTRAALLTFLRRQYTIDGLRLLTGTYEDIRRPVLQVHGVEDASIPIAAARKLSPRLGESRFEAVGGVGHDVHVEAPAKLAEIIDRFVRETPNSDERIGVLARKAPSAR